MNERRQPAEELPALLRGPISAETRHRLQHMGTELRRMQGDLEELALEGSLDPRLLHGVRMMWNLLRWDLLQLAERRRWAWPEDWDEHA